MKLGDKLITTLNTPHPHHLQARGFINEAIKPALECPHHAGHQNRMEAAL